MAAPIQSTDTTMDKFTKLLPADVTAAFISTKAALGAAAPGGNSNAPIFWTFLVILCLCPLYFKRVGKVVNFWQRLFLLVSSIIFALSLANKELVGFFIDLAKMYPGLAISAPSIEPTITGLAIVAPILWTLIVSQIATSSFTEQAAPVTTAVTPKTPITSNTPVTPKAPVTPDKVA